MASVLLAFVAAVAVPSLAQADQVSDKQAQAARVADRLDQLDAKVEQLAEDYDQSQADLADLNTQIKATQEQLAKNQAAVDSVRGRMSEWAVNAYVEGSSADPMLNILQPADSLDDAAGAEGYTDAALRRDDQLTGQLQQSGEDTARLQARLKDQQERAQKLTETVAAKQRAAEGAEADARQQLAQANAALGQAVVEAEQARRARAAEISAGEAASAARRNGGGRATGSSPGAGRVVPPPSPGARGAVAAARSQIGVAYHWGEMDPGGGFDCSGLTAWAWSQAGRGLPHSSRAQYNATTHVDVEDIQPGDLVFFGHPIHHVGIYVGNGIMIHAPHSGARVQEAPAFRRDLVGVGRP
jgi:cell wall-associated NlpC family hydrolase